ncbi:AAA family ATPase, partial [Candidatus Bipolaricaulota bacterium]|nr:AAA family ATPase [Candidatus Bipolaricaulota bacterium]
MEGSKLFTVGKASPKDVGLGIARMDREDMLELGVDPGDVILIEGRSKTATKAMPKKDSSGKGILTVDGLIRNNAGAGIDKQVEVSKWRSTPANSVRLKTTSGVEIDADSFS